MTDLDNPFSVTKATEFTDIEIFNYWVEFGYNNQDTIFSILNPTEYLPKYLTGGKGCGKTHILKYSSYPLQKIRKNNNIERILKDEKYIGLYYELHGLNTSRFKGKGLPDDQWNSIFEYYFELYVCGNLLKTLKDVLISLKVTSAEEENIIKKICKLFSSEKLTSFSTIDDLTDYINELRSKIDVQINNVAFTRKLDYEEVKTLFSPGELIFGIPEIISTNVNQLKNVKLIYIFDEIEKLFEWQKIFINTLVWDKRKPVTFWIGLRTHGFTTRLTKSGESLREGSEFQTVNLDSIIRKNENL